MNACEHIFYDFPLPGVMIAVNILKTFSVQNIINVEYILSSQIQ